MGTSREPPSEEDAMTATETGKDAPAGTQAIGRTLNVLESFLDRRELGITELARRLDLSPSTAHRIVRALVARGYLEQDRDSERYHLGRSTIVLGQAGRRHMGLDQALPILERFGAETGESVNMGLLDGQHVVVTLRVTSPQPLRFDQPVGSRVPVHCSSMGKALLAFEAQNGPADLAQIPFTAVTSNSITSVEELLEDLDGVRGRGYSIDDEESILGVSCVGAPILDASGRAVAAMAVQAPTARMTPDRSTELGARIVVVAAEVARTMHLDVRSP
jgi:IclR family acetate operon transcriptional repressor